MYDFPWDLKIIIQSVESLKHTWKDEVMADALSATFAVTRSFPKVPRVPSPPPLSTNPEILPVMDCSFSRFWMTLYDAHIEHIPEIDFGDAILAPAQQISRQSSLQASDLRIQSTDAPEVSNTVTTPRPTSLRRPISVPTIPSLCVGPEPISSAHQMT